MMGNWVSFYSIVSRHTCKSSAYWWKAYMLVGSTQKSHFHMLIFMSSSWWILLVDVISLTCSGGNLRKVLYFWMIIWLVRPFPRATFLINSRQKSSYDVHTWWLEQGGREPCSALRCKLKEDGIKQRERLSQRVHDIWWIATKYCGRSFLGKICSDKS